MKKILSLFAILMVAMTAWAIEPVAPTVGDGNEGSPYELGTPGNLVWFAQQVNGGETSIHGKLTADIDLGDDQTMIGSYENIYLGTFDGDGHTVTINYTATGDYTALFRYIGGATIKNLMTAGSITTGYCYAGGIVAYCRHPNSYNVVYHTYIQNCASSVTITSTFTQTKDANHGGIVAYSSDNIHLTNVLFNGKLRGNKAQYCGGLIAFLPFFRSAQIENCLFSPAEMTVSQNKSSTLVFSVISEIKNSYYTKVLGSAQGTKATAQAVASGELCYKLNNGKSNGTQAWYQNLDNGNTVDATPVPFKTHGTVYGGASQCPSGSYSNTYHPHPFGAYDDDGIAYCTKPDCTGRSNKPAKQDNSGTYIITSKGNLIWFAEQVNAGQTGINGKLYANIDLGDDQTMIGTSTNKYAGTFDGDGYSIKVNYTATADVTALFRYVKNGTIKNLLTTGNINTNHINAAGVAGLCEGFTLEKVVSAVTINSTYNGKATHGGLVAETKTNNSSLTDCAFVGQLNGESTTNCAGFVGFHGSGSLSLYNSYLAPSADFTVSGEGSKTLVRTDGTPSIDKCYYTLHLGEDEGIPIDGRWLTDGVLITLLGDKVWSQDPVLNVPVPYYLNTQSSKNSDPLSSKYLKLTAIDAGEICINKTGTINATLEYMSADIPIMWHDVEYGQNIQLTKGESIYLRAKGENGRNATLNEGEKNYLTFTSSMDVKARQNIMSLLDASCELKEVPAYGFYKLFDGWSHLTQAPDLPAVTLHSNSYEYMFRGCKKLKTIPDMSQVRLPNDDCFWACRFMFSDCSSLRVNTLGLGSEWKLQSDNTGTGTNHSFYGIFSGTGGNFTDTPQKDVVYYIYNDEPYTRNMTNEWGTVVLPFDVSYDADNTNHELYHLTAANSENLALTEFETGTMPAGTPMVVKAIGEKNNDDMYTISIPSAKGKFSGTVNEQNSTNASLPADWTMTGTYSNLSNQTGIYFIARNQFWWAEDPITIAPFRAWFTGPVFTSNTAKSLYIVIDDETTDISSVNNEQLIVNNGKFIENGRIVIRKDGKKYNAQGQLLKY